MTVAFAGVAGVPGPGFCTGAALHLAANFDWNPCPLTMPSSPMSPTNVLLVPLPGPSVQFTLTVTVLPVMLPATVPVVLVPGVHMMAYAGFPLGSAVICLPDHP